MQVEASLQRLSCLGLIVMAKLQLVELINENLPELLCNGSNWRMLHSFLAKHHNNNRRNQFHKQVTLLTENNRLGLLSQSKQTTTPDNPSSSRSFLLDRRWLFLLIKLKLSRKMELLLPQRHVDSSRSSNQALIRFQIIVGSPVTKLKQQVSSSLHLWFKKFQTEWLQEVVLLPQSILSHCLYSQLQSHQQ